MSRCSAMTSSTGSTSSGRFPRRWSIWRGSSCRPNTAWLPISSCPGCARPEWPRISTRSAMSSAATRANVPGLPCLHARLALRHRARRRQMGRAARHHHRDRLRRRFEPARACGCRSRSKWSASPTRRACAFPRPCSAAARSPARLIESVLDARDRDGITMREAMAQFGLDAGTNRRGGADAPRTACLCRTAHRAGAGAGGRRPSRGRGDRDHRRDAAGGTSCRHGRPRRHGADGAAARRAGGRCRMRRRDRANAARPTLQAWSAPSA